ncbi:DUF1045 domain-containing protein [Shimia sp. MIT910701]|jgi:putative phosphonate metabolism protein|uniref:DUF1045 domain-containing protein n=1 Tax=Shimia sp. MIT910701 TaxID=3096987 RepID=UPI003999FF3E
MQFQRYGVYYTPHPGALADFGKSWLGWDLVSGQTVAHPEMDGLPRPVADITATPRKYGLHGTIKPPFFLAEGADAGELARRFEALCTTLAPVTLGGLVLARLGGFIALKVDGDQTPLANLAGAVVRELDDFRAPPTEAELARRRKAKLSAKQEELLAQWGYPYVMEEFRFHITLSGRLGSDVEATMDALAPHITPLLPRPFEVDSLTLVGEDITGKFHEIHRQTLSG